MRKVFVLFPTPADPATLDPTKVPVSRHVSASIDGVEVLPERKYEMTETEVDGVTADPGKKIDYRFYEKDESGLPSDVLEWSHVVAAPPDTTPPDMPQPFTGVRYEDPVAVETPASPPETPPAAEVPTPAEPPAAEVPAEPPATPPAAETPAAPAEPAPEVPAPETPATPETPAAETPAEPATPAADPAAPPAA